MTGKAFGDGYYEAEDADDGWKPGDDPLEGLGDLDQYTNTDHETAEIHEMGDGGAASAGAASAAGAGAGEGGEEEEEEDWEGDEGEWGGEEGEGEGEEEFAGMGARKERLLDELYKLDYEDIVGDIPCRYVWCGVVCCGAVWFGVVRVSSVPLITPYYGSI